MSYEGLAMKKAILLGAFALVPPGTGCRSCTLLYSPSMLTVAVDGGVLQAGLYEIEVSEIPFGGYETAMCVVQLPWDNGDPVNCTSNAYLDVQQDEIRGIITTNFVPERFTVTVLRDGEPLAQEDFEAAYATNYPNGKGCGIRYSGSVILAI